VSAVAAAATGGGALAVAEPVAQRRGAAALVPSGSAGAILSSALFVALALLALALLPAQALVPRRLVAAVRPGQIRAVRVRLGVAGLWLLAAVAALWAILAL
jgi:hypothetical protein